MNENERHDFIAWLKSLARDGANRLHATAAATTKPVKLTDAESAARARKRLEEDQ